MLLRRSSLQMKLAAADEVCRRSCSCSCRRRRRREPSSLSSEQRARERQRARGGGRIGAVVLREATAVVPAAVQPRSAPPKLLPSPSLRKLTGVAGGYCRSTWFCFESHNRVCGRQRPYLKPLSSWVLVVASYSAIRCCRNQARFTVLLPSGQTHRSLITFFASPPFCSSVAARCRGCCCLYGSYCCHCRHELKEKGLSR
ncbi:uncharacterized protein LOC130979220 [Arachis stenosperma]|uniref:uncharacterized protein LOC130979220 n=1 Tax=Arachis stenosperma TaxID=217475 RepID=UPI0025AC884E|nr:uncharacterized protein LOC130979220 [Arachis stenosperma]